MLLFLLKYWKALTLVILLAILSYISYDYGYNTASTKYKEEIAIKEAILNDKVDALQNTALSLLDSQISYTNKLSEDLRDLTNGIKTKQLVVIKNGECTPSQTFSDSFGEVNKRVNQSMQGSHK